MYNTANIEQWLLAGTAARFCAFTAHVNELISLGVEDRNSVDQCEKFLEYEYEPFDVLSEH